MQSSADARMKRERPLASMHSPEPIVEDNRGTRQGTILSCTALVLAAGLTHRLRRFLPPARHRSITQKCSHRGQIASGGTSGATVKGAASRGKERSRGRSLLVVGTVALVCTCMAGYECIYTESEILQIQALVTNAVLSCIRAGTWDTECIYTLACISSSTTVTSKTRSKQYCTNTKKNATAIRHQLFAQVLAALRGPDRSISNVLPGVRG